VVRVGPDFAEEFPDGDARSTEVHATLVRTGEALLQELDQRIQATFGVAQPVATALAVIEGADGPLTPSEISARVIVPSATMTATLDTLERRGWIERRANPEDRRSTLVAITEEGRLVVDRLLPGIRALEQASVARLTPKELDTLLRLLGKVLEGVADVAAADPEPLDGRRRRPKR
jgi:DNA-binding MarR family transcriptional regulator